MAKTLPLSARHFFALAGSNSARSGQACGCSTMSGADDRLPYTAQIGCATLLALIFSPACSLITTKLSFECPLIALARTSLATQTDTETIRPRLAHKCLSPCDGLCTRPVTKIKVRSLSIARVGCQNACHPKCATVSWPSGRVSSETVNCRSGTSIRRAKCLLCSHSQFALSSLDLLLSCPLCASRQS